MENVLEIVRQQVEEGLIKLDVRGMVTAEHVAESVLHQTVYWEKPMLGGEKLIFIRFFSPVVQREEVFLGNILLNDFLSKTFARAITEGELGKAELVANDLENYYFLLCTTTGVAHLIDAFRSEVDRNLPGLFFADQDEARGIYGTLETMLDFKKANVEPFPVFIMPWAYAEQLEKAVRRSLLRKIDKSLLNRNPTSIMANLAFFYSHDGTEMQSPSKFLGHLAIEHGVIRLSELEEALNIPKSGRCQVVNATKLESLFTEAQKRALRILACNIYKNLSSQARFGWLKLFFAKTEKGAWELDAGKPKKQRSVARVLSKIVDMKPDDVFDEIVKSVIAHRLFNVDVCHTEGLRDILKKAVVKLGENIEANPGTWQMPHIRSKFLPHDEKMLTDALIDDLSLGHVIVRASKEPVDIGCRVCGVKTIGAEDKSILMGQNTHKFHNQSGKQKSKKKPKTCLRCAVCTYLMVKLIGSEAVGQPQIPKSYNLVFHYGKHDDDEVDHIAQRIDLIWSLVRQHREADQIRRDTANQVRDLKTKYDRERKAQKKQTLATSLAEKEANLQQAEAAVTKVEGDILTACPWLKELEASPVPTENCSLDALANIQLSQTKVERHILGLGIGGYRMILFVLPQIRAPRDAKEHDFAQRRFSDSRVTVTAMLSFLRELCGCDGPFYYQSLPTLTPDTFQRDMFYVHNEPISVKQAQNEYEVVTQLSWKLIRQRGSGGFVRKVVLAEKLLEDPLGTFAAVMRDSAILGQAKGSYRKLGGKYRNDWRAQDLTEYAKFIQRLSKLTEVKEHGITS